VFLVGVNLTENFAGSMRWQSFLFSGFCAVQIYDLPVGVLLRAWVGRVTDTCMLSVVNYDGPDGWSGVSG